MTTIRHGAVAVALVAALISCAEDEPSATPGTGGPTTSDATPADATAECQTTVGDGQALAAGCWAIRLDEDPVSRRAELELPAGFTGGDWGVWRNGTQEGEWGTIALRGVGDVYADPCHRDGPPSTGSSVQDFTTALAAQQVTVATSPVPVTLDGHDGLYLELSVPEDVDTSVCRDQELILWGGAAETDVGADPSYGSRFWVLDLDGHTVVLVVNAHPEATEESIDLFTSIVESAYFDED